MRNAELSLADPKLAPGFHESSAVIVMDHPIVAVAVSNENVAFETSLPRPLDD